MIIFSFYFNIESVINSIFFVIIFDFFLIVFILKNLIIFVVTEVLNWKSPPKFPRDQFMQVQCIN